jgi:hypothetical protein
MARTKNLAALQEALDRKKGQPEPPPARRADKTDTPGSYKAPSREGKTPITAYLSLDYKASLRLIQAKRGGTTQALIAEALNDLFTKYDVPTVSGE